MVVVVQSRERSEDPEGWPGALNDAVESFLLYVLHFFERWSRVLIMLAQNSSPNCRVCAGTSGQGTFYSRGEQRCGRYQDQGISRKIGPSHESV